MITLDPISDKGTLAITLEKGELRVLKPADAHQQYINGLNDPEVNRYLFEANKVSQTKDTVLEYINLNLAADDSLLFGFWPHGCANHVGTIRLHDITDTAATIGICLFDKSYWGGGIGAAMIVAVRDWALSALGLTHLYAGITPENMASQRCFEKAGFIYFKDAVYASTGSNANPVYKKYCYKGATA